MMRSTTWNKAVAPQFLFSTHEHSPIKVSVRRRKKEADGKPFTGIGLTEGPIDR